MYERQSLPSRSARSSSPQGGFTLVELVVTLFVFGVVLIGVLQIFDSSVRVSREQTYVADMQQSVRVAQNDIVRYVRMAGRGGLPQILAVVPRNGVAAGSHIGDGSSALVRPGTDVLTLRGVFSAPLYQVNPAAGVLTVNIGSPTTGTVTVVNPSPTGVPQDLEPLKRAVDEDRPEAILLVSGVGEGVWAVVELVPGSSDTSDYPNSLSLGFTTTTAFDALCSGLGFDNDLQTASHVGILEEHRFFIEDRTDGLGDPAPRLSRVRYYPNTDNEHPDSAGVLADNILDLQLAFGFDTNNDMQAHEDSPPSKTDEWQGNHAEDADILATGVPFYYVRLSTLARTDRRDLDYVSPPINAIEDHGYSESPLPSTPADILQRRFRRRLLVGTIDLRNLN